MSEDYDFQEAGICRNPDCNQKILNYHAGCCPRCGTWQDPNEDPGIIWEAKIVYHNKDVKVFSGSAVKEVFQSTQEGKDE